MSNQQTVQDIYAAFGSGDIPAILSHLHEDIEWEYGMVDNDVPWFQKRKGRAAVPGFFGALGAVEFKNFQPKMLLENGNLVVSLIDVAFEVKSTGRLVHEENVIHLWHFDNHGLVTKFGHKCDTYQHWAALRVE